MVNRKQFVTVTLGAVILIAMALIPISSQQLGTYDPWLDVNNDGKIDIQDLAMVARAYGTQGTPIDKSAYPLVFAKWNVTWMTVTGSGDDIQWGAVVGTSEFCSTFDYDWKLGEVFAGHSDYIGFQAVMTVKVQRNGPVGFSIGSDDGLMLYVDGTGVLDTWGAHYYETNRAVVELSQGYHTLALLYYELTYPARVSFDCDSDILAWYP